MHLTNNSTHSISESDLRELISNQVAEGKNIEYKSILSVNTEEDKKEFLTDVSSFANTAGGHIIYGMTEDKGIPLDLVGMNISDPDKEKLRIEEIIRNGILPRIAGVSIHIVQLENQNSAIVIFIPKSWSAPHVVTYKKSSRFFARHSSGKYQLDVQEIRQAFLLSETTAERIKAFRLDRLSQIRSGETPTAMENKAKMIFHCIPLNAFQSLETIDINIISKDFSNFFPEMHYRKFNLDGLLLYKSRTDSEAASYVQLFRNGQLEFVDGDIAFQADNKSQWLIPSVDIERDIIKMSKSFFDSLTVLEVEPPCFLFLSFLGVKNHTLAGLHQMSWRTGSSYNIDRDAVLISEMLIENYPPDLDAISKLLRPIFDMMWNASGGERSYNYDENGTWRPRQ
jgi:hypothetical protein